MKQQYLIISIVAAAVVAGGAGFYGGMSYGQAASSANQQGYRNFSNANSGRRLQAGMSLSNGQILAKDDKSITIQMRTGGSQIVFISGTTAVMKSATGSVADLSVGEQVVVTGTTNSDGSMSAQSVQIRPTLPTNSQNQ